MCFLYEKIEVFFVSVRDFNFKIETYVIYSLLLHFFSACINTD